MSEIKQNNLKGSFTNSKISEYENFIDDVLSESEIPFIKNNKKIEYANVPSAFDIESTSFYYGDKKCATMYVWQFGINGIITFGRTWDEFITLMDNLTTRLELSVKRRLIVYVHFLSFEFQFFRKWFEWESVFSIEERKPLYALTKTGIEFRCSYLLSGYGLDELGKQLKKYPVRKMVGDLDYSLPRHSQTPLTDKELKYCENDIRVVMSYIQEKIETEIDITHIPYTKTGYVRNYCRNACMYDGSHRKNTYKFMIYRRLMNALQITPDEYTALKNAFQGGFTHANAFYSGKTIENVGSFDFTSSYPAVMLSEQFPMSKAEIIERRMTETEFERNLALYCCLFDIELSGVEAVTLFEHPISSSRCYYQRGVVEDNGRVVEADLIRMTITEQDYFIIKKFYKWKSKRIGTFRRYRRGYLPTDFIKSILKLYADKTTLKGVADREDDYQRSKEMINSCYGMCVTDICRDEITYKGINWGKTAVDVEKEIERNNTSLKRFLYFPWGVWVTAYARKNLFSGIYEFGTDYIYSDTDSIKAINIEDHREYIERYNQMIIGKLERACKYHGIDPAAIRPKTIKGVEKPLGVWDFEGRYSRFKTLGAKRYIVEKDAALNINGKSYNISITVSGVNKRAAVPYLTEKYGDKVFEAFKDGLRIPAENTGKMTHTYIDEPFSVPLTDYLGNTIIVSEKSCVHLEPTEYELSIYPNYVNYLKGIKQYEK